MLTVIILEYRDRGFTEEAVRSVLNQTVKPDRIILSTAADRTYIDDRVTIMHDPTESGGERIYNATKENPSDMYAFLEDDDVWLPNHIEELYPYYKRIDGKRGMFYCAANDYDEKASLPGNVSTKAITGNADFGKIGRFTAIIDTVLYLQALEQDMEIVPNDMITVHYRIHSSNWSRGNQEWKSLRDQMLAALPVEYPHGRAHEVAEYYMQRDIGQ
jgi:hypothetical protein